MKKKSFRFIGRSILVGCSYILALGVQVAIFFALYEIECSNIVENIIVTSILIMLLSIFAFITINLIRVSKFKKKYDKKQVKENIDYLESQYDEAQKDYLAQEQIVLKKKNKIVAYKILMFIFFIVLSILCSIATEKESQPSSTGFFILLGIVSIFISPWFFIDLLIPYEYDSQYYLKELSIKEFPEFYKIAEDAKKALGCTKAIKIYPTYNQDISVTSTMPHIQIFFDCEDVAILTKEELYQVMLHEIAHVVNLDTKRSRSLEHFVMGMEGLGSVMTRIFFNAEYLDFCIKKMLYELACTRFYEQQADEAVKKYGDGQTYINGLAKGMMLTFFKGCYKPDVVFELYENESVPSDYFFKHLEQFKQYIPKYFERWDYILRHQIISKHDTHPTFAMRMKTMGVEDYDLSFEMPEDNYSLEQKKLIELGCQMIRETNDSFKHYKEQYYLPTKAKHEEYHSLVENGTELTSLQKTEYIPTLFEVDREECLKLCDEVLIESPKNLYANYYKGVILADNLDRACVDYLYTAADGSLNFYESANYCVGDFACKVGDEELLNQYRSRTKKGLIEKEDREKNSKLQQEGAYTKNRLKNEDFNEILDYIAEAGKDFLQGIYSVSCDKEEGMLTCYLLEWKPEMIFSDVEEAYDKTFSFLDRYKDGEGPEYHFELRQIFPCIKADKEYNKIANKIKQTEESLIYSIDEGKKTRD